jgi:hypothetical protein
MCTHVRNAEKYWFWKTLWYAVSRAVSWHKGHRWGCPGLTRSPEKLQIGLKHFHENIHQVVYSDLLYLWLEMMSYIWHGELFVTCTKMDGSYYFLILSSKMTSTFVYHPQILNQSKMKFGPSRCSNNIEIEIAYWTHLKCSYRWCMLVICPYQCPAVVSQYSWTSLALVLLLHHRYFLMKAFLTVITNSSQVCWLKVGLWLQKMNFWWLFASYVSSHMTLPRWCSYMIFYFLFCPPTGHLKKEVEPSWEKLWF